MYSRLAASIALALAMTGSASAQPTRANAPAARSPNTLFSRTFVREDLASEVVRLESTLKAEAAAQLGRRTGEEWKGKGDLAANSGDWRTALTAYAAAVAVQPSDPDAWLGYSKAAQSASPQDGGERYRLGTRAVAAAYAAYGRARDRAGAVAALDRLGAALAARSEWRPALDAYRARLALADDPAARGTYEDLREKHGFRILGYRVDSDAAAPRVCFQFSEPLAAKVDLAPFVAISGSANGAITGVGSEICADGLKHGERYAFVLRQGLPSAIPDEALLKAADYDIYVRDRSPQVRFTGRNYVLPRTGQVGIPLVSVNAPRLDVEVARIGDRNLLPTLRADDFLSQLSGDAARTIAREKGVRVWKGVLDTASAEPNQDATTAFPVLQAVGRLEPGLYVMTARPSTGRPADAQDDASADDERATQWFVVSNLGLTALSGPDGVHALVRALDSAAPVADVSVRLVARNNEVLATKRTDESGHAVFDPGLSRGQNGMAPGLLVAQDGDDYGFLDLAASAFDLTDRGVKGRADTGLPEAYLFPERGVYRSGETAFVTALLRDAAGRALTGLPLTLVVRRPDGVEYRRVQVADEGLGGRAFAIPLLSGAARGTWRVAAYTDPKGTPVGETAFLVEDYVPERLELSLIPKDPALRPGQPAEVALSARFLYGAPGADLDVAGNATVEQAPDPTVKGLERYTIGLDDEEVQAASAELEEHARTDAEGKASVTMPLPDITATRPLQARIALHVSEDGGRAVSRSVTVPLLPSGPVLGLRLATGQPPREGTDATFDIVAATPDGTRLTPRDVTWTLSEVERRYQWYRRDGRWSYEVVRSASKVAEGTTALTADEPARVSAPVGYGAYRLEVRAPGLATASLSFSVGWSGGETADAPDLLDLTLDKASYAAGETLRAHLRPRFAGKATVAVVSERLRDLQVIDLPAGETTVEIPVKPEWGAGAYLVASAYRPLDVAGRRMPSRAIGTAWFAVDPATRSLGVLLGTPSTMRPRGTLNVPVRLTGLAPGEEARLTVAAVDVGILSLTHYAVPDPFRYFFGQKALSTDLRDLYGQLIDGMQGSAGAIRSGGDAGDVALAESPPSQAPFARYSGVVKVGADGTAAVDIEVPAFNGTARLMAVAWTAARVGSAAAEVTIRDPVVLTGTLPRFLSVGDRSRISVTLDNVEAEGGDYTVDLDLTGPVVAPAEAAHRSIRLAKGARTTLAIPLTAAAPGAARIALRLTGPGIEGDAGQSFALAVQPATGPLVRRTVRTLAPKTAMTVSRDLLNDLLPGTGAVSISASPFAALDVPALLSALDRYPYGCTEQTVSRAMPLLYANRLAALDRLGLDDGLDGRVRESIDRVLARQGSDGAFGLWSVGGDDLWLDAYATDFLTRARERGFTVPQTAVTLALDRLRNAVANVSSIDRNGPEIAYAAYVLARSGRPVIGDLRYLADTKLGDFGTPLARGQIGAALALVGDRGRADIAFASAVDMLRRERDGIAYRPDYGSRLRDGAALLALAGETDLGRDAIRPVGAVLAQERAEGRPTSTQENAWMVLAAQSLSRRADRMALRLDGAEWNGPLYRTLKAAALDAAPVTLANDSEGPVDVVVSVSGNPVGPEPAESHGYTVERAAYRLDGTPVDLSQVHQNDRIAIVLKVTEAQAREAHALLVDRLPAGFEIDNPKLADADAFSNLAMLATDVQPTHTEFRDDRFVATYDRTATQSAFFTVGYVVRAVSPGSYVQPAATMEDMYRPERYGRTAFGRVEVAPARP